LYIFDAYRRCFRLLRAAIFMPLRHSFSPYVPALRYLIALSPRAPYTIAMLLISPVAMRQLCRFAEMILVFLFTDTGIFLLRLLISDIYTFTIFPSSF